MKIIEKDINSLIPYEFNNKIHDEQQINRIANSIKEFGFRNPILIDKNNVIISGHGRLEGAKKLGLEKVPCLIADDLTEKQIKKFRILDNKLNESAYNLENLKIEIDSLDDFNFGDLSFSGIDLFPELEDVDVDSDGFGGQDMSDKIGGEYSILLKFTTPEEQQVMYDTLQEMGGFRDIKIL